METIGTLKILIAEDHRQMREQYVESLARFNIETIGQAANGLEMLELLKRHKPDAVLLDLNMPVMDGNRTLDKILSTYPGTKVIILSYHDSNLLINDYVKRGARGYIAKDRGDADVIADAIRTVAKGETVVIKVNDATNRRYSRRQADMIPMICDGFSNEQIAAKLGISKSGVEKQKQKIYLKTGTDSSTSFLKFAFKNGLDYLSRIYKRRF